MFRKNILMTAAVGLLAFGSTVETALPSSSDDVATALSMAQLLRAARSVISANQSLINNPDIGDKGLSGEVVLAAAIENYKKAEGADPRSLDPASRQGRLLNAEMQAIMEVTNENQSFINKKGVGFKAFIPAVFGRLVGERLREKVGSEAEIKITAPPALVRNRKARPDDWEKRVIQTKFMSADWAHGKLYSENHPNNGRNAFRVMVPEYYAASCLSCHGEKKGEIDITGYPKEGAHKGDLGGAISITLFDRKQ